MDDDDDDDGGGGDDDDDDDVDVDVDDVDARACAAEIQINISQGPFCVEIYRTSGVRQSRDTRFCASEPAQSKCTWTCHKSHFVRKFTG